MMTHLINNRGTFRIDRKVGDLGQFTVASGTKDPEVFREINRPGGFLDMLLKIGREDLARDIRDSRKRAVKVYEAYLAGKLHELKSVSISGDLKSSLLDWLDAIENSDTRRGYQGELRRAGCLRVGLPISELPSLLRSYRLACKAKKVWRAFNLARAAGLSFVAENFGASSELYQQISDIKNLKRTAKRKLPPAPSHEQFVAKLATMPLAVADCCRGMAYTSQNPKEFWAKDGWEVLPDRVHIEGTKRDGRIRDIPYLVPLVKPTIARVTFRKQLKKLWPEVSPKHFRNFFSRWYAEAGVPQIRWDLYMGHGAKTMADLYPRAEVDRYLVDDAETFKKFHGLKTRDMLRVEKAG